MPNDDTIPPEPGPATVDEPPEEPGLSEEALAELDSLAEEDGYGPQDTAVDLPALDVPDFDDDLDGDPTDPGQPADDGLTPDETVADV